MKTAKKPGRNAPCYCKSGKKYKKCHLREDQLPYLKGTPDRLILTKNGIALMKRAGAFNSFLMDHIRTIIEPGIALSKIDDEVLEFTLANGHTPATLGYKGFPASCCTSVNDVVCHGIPDSYVLQDGDIVNVDLTSIVDDWHGDQSETFLIGEVSDEARNVTQCAFDSLWAGINAIKANGLIGDIGTAIEHHVTGRGLSVVKAFQGHGIGRKFHQEPGVPHFYDPKTANFVVKPGMCFTIEPMVNVGDIACTVGPDGWTAKTKDGSLSAQFEHTILMTDNGPEVLTLTRKGPQEGHKF